MIGQGVVTPSYTQRPAFFAGILGALAIIAGMLLVLGDTGTRDTIALRQKEDLQASLRQVLPAALYNNDPASSYLDLPLAGGALRRVYLAQYDQQLVALAFETQEYGYAGAIRLVMGLRLDGEILGVRVLAHTETPGLGDKIELQRHPWIRSFDGLSLDSLPLARWAVKKDGGHFDQFSGATITPRAVVKAVKQGLLWQREQQPALQQRWQQDLEQSAGQPVSVPPDAAISEEVAQ